MARTKGAVDLRPREPYTWHKGWAGGPKPVSNWPGPFRPRRDIPTGLRPALWLNCAWCHQLFSREITYLKNKRGRNGRIGDSFFCTNSCAGKSKRGFLEKMCSICDRPFITERRTGGVRVYCSDSCSRTAQGRALSLLKNRKTAQYLLEHGLTSKEQLVCEFCGGKQKWRGKTPHSKVRVTDRGQNLTAICSSCFDRSVDIRNRG